MPVLICKDCKFCVPLAGVRSKSPSCSHPDSRDYVSGDWLPCEYSRANTMRCGPDALFFQPKDGEFKDNTGKT